MRMFVAARPPEAAVADLEAFLEPRRHAAAFRWTDPDQLHLTLAFMPDVPERALDELVEALGTAAARRCPVNARVAGGGAFPNAGAAKVIWAGLETDLAELTALARGCRTAATTSGVGVDGQRFRAHLTLARCGRPAEVSNWVRLLDGYRGPGWELGEVTLVASHLGEGRRRRPRYEVVASCSLGAR